MNEENIVIIKKKSKQGNYKDIEKRKESKKLNARKHRLINKQKKEKEYIVHEIKKIVYKIMFSLLKIYNILQFVYLA
jgi:hypothetical protein